MTEPLTEKLLSCYRVKGFTSLLVCFAFIFCRVMTFIRHIGVDFTFGLLDCVRYNEGFHRFYCNFGRAEECRSLLRGLCHIEVRYNEVPLFLKWPRFEYRRRRHMWEFVVCPLPAPGRFFPGTPGFPLPSKRQHFLI